MRDDLSFRAMNAAIDDLEDALKYIVNAEDKITLPQFRRLKSIRRSFADFLVRAVRADNNAPPEKDDAS